MSEEAIVPAYRIHTPRLVVRCWAPSDAPLLKTALDESLEHLLPWMPWADQEPELVEAKVARLRRFRGEFDLDRDYVYGILDREETRVLGGTGLHTRLGEGALEIGYWIHADHINRGLATEAAGALTRVAFEVHGVDRVEIHNDPANMRSAAVPRKLGFTHEATLRCRTVTSGGSPRDTMIWTLFASDYAASPAAQVRLEAFDVIGKRIL
jgi:RimJ/RimL family protein N-acetyltransferase